MKAAALIAAAIAVDLVLGVDGLKALALFAAVWFSVQGLLFLCVLVIIAKGHADIEAGRDDYPVKW